MDFDFHRGEYDRLLTVLNEAYEETSLPEVPSAKPALNNFLIRLRGCR